MNVVLQISLIDEFKHPKTGRESKCFRFNYRSMDRSLTNEEIDALQVSYCRSSCVLLIQNIRNTIKCMFLTMHSLCLLHCCCAQDIVRDRITNELGVELR